MNTISLQIISSTWFTGIRILKRRKRDAAPKGILWSEWGVKAHRALLKRHLSRQTAPLARKVVFLEG